ncbi:MAG: hypothetical protein ACRDHW_10295 [Ktedonobacteraceae bacterium]
MLNRVMGVGDYYTANGAVGPGRASDRYGNLLIGTLDQQCQRFFACGSQIREDDCQVVFAVCIDMILIMLIDPRYKRFPIRRTAYTVYALICACDTTSVSIISARVGISSSKIL